jgi:molybdopterin molybdotransferase
VGSRDRCQRERRFGEVSALAAREKTGKMQRERQRLLAQVDFRASSMITFDEAQARLFGLASRLLSERIAIEDADARVMAEDVFAPTDLPPFSYSAMDGYAVRTRELVGVGPWRRAVRGESRTGRVPSAMAPETTMRIFTGAEMPEGADAVVMQEKVERSGDEAFFATKPKVGANVRPRGEDLARGAIAVARGTKLGPGHLAALAAVDCASVAVARRPIVEILSTGDELRAPGSARRPGTIPESNGAALRSMAERCGARARVLPVVRDDQSSIEDAIDRALHRADLLVTVGGVSVGEHDLVRPALARLGVNIDFWKVAIKPGKPIAVGRREDKIVMGLPGNPTSAMVTFALFGLPLLRAMQGDNQPFRLPLRARLARAYRHEVGRQEFVRANLQRTHQGMVVEPALLQASGSAIAIAQCDSLFSIPADVADYAAGTEVDVWPWSELLA